MSLPRSDYDPRRVCLNPFPFLNNINLGKQRRTFGVYVAGGLFALGIWAFFDAAILSAHAHPPYNEPDYPVPDRIRGEDGFGDAHAVWRARLFLFVGFALMAGGLQAALMVLKYIIPGYPEQYQYYGYANVAENVSLMLSASGNGEYEYNLSI
ncbi:hypothetical protein BJV77DRAFT_1058704 [Russula vinacea]|nr:hypothetical protein BJV77DRAFT_1058704 [Russula vinacea]